MVVPILPVSKRRILILGSIVTVLGRELGASFHVLSFREGEPMPVTCDMLSALDLPTGIPDEMAKFLKWLRGLRSTCVTYGLAWHDLSYRAAP